MKLRSSLYLEWWTGSWVMGAGCHVLTHMYQLPLCPALLSWPHTESSVLNRYENNWIIFMVAGLKWVSAGSNMRSREGRGVGIWQPAAWSHRPALVSLPRSHKLLSARNWNLSCFMQGDDHRSVKCTNWQKVALDWFYLNVLFVCKYWCMN